MTEAVHSLLRYQVSNTYGELEPYGKITPLVLCLVTEYASCLSRGSPFPGVCQVRSFPTRSCRMRYAASGLRSPLWLCAAQRQYGQGVVSMFKCIL